MYVFPVSSVTLQLYLHLLIFWILLDSATVVPVELFCYLDVLVIAFADSIRGVKMLFDQAVSVTAHFGNVLRGEVSLAQMCWIGVPLLSQSSVLYIWLSGDTRLSIRWSFYLCFSALAMVE
ncbi:Uncharacterized protein APZ42_014183 [Daphnia magna]|uniref:Uncharacterized protein n=1 Tax=Daphnia magna TaxID=35525 RepID=A0A162Q0T9_9CRUS|nr:Uncharacterized protein APZ42_014183 [Daphnia magna]